MATGLTTDTLSAILPDALPNFLVSYWIVNRLGPVEVCEGGGKDEGRCQYQGGSRSFVINAIQMS